MINREYWEAEFYICFTLYMVPNNGTKKNSKKRGAGMILAPAVKWAEMAADHENGGNSKTFFFPALGHYVAC